MDNISANKYFLIQSDSEFRKKYYLFSPLNFKFTFIGINSRKGVLSNKKVRQAIAHLLNKEDVVNTIEKSYAQTTIGPINPKFKYNDKIVPHQTDINQAKLLFSQSGLSNKCGKRYEQNEVNPLELSLIYKQNTELEAIAQIFKASVEKIGLKMVLTEFSNATLYKKIDSRDFDIFIGTLTGSPFSFNFSPIFSTEAAQLGGYNDTGFGNAKSDSLIHAINFARDSLRREMHYLGYRKCFMMKLRCSFSTFHKTKWPLVKNLPP